MASKFKIEVQGMPDVLATLKRRQVKAGNPQPEVFIGFAASYAVYVHEMVWVPHAIGMAKFLEIPARMMAGRLSAEIKTALQGGKTLEVALLQAGRLLQKEAQKRTPVDTGFLRRSAFTRLAAEAGVGRLVTH